MSPLIPFFRRWTLTGCCYPKRDERGLNNFVLRLCNRTWLASSASSGIASTRETAHSRCAELHAAVKAGADESEIISHLDKLTYISARWPFDIDGQKVLGELLHDICELGKHKALDRLVSDLNDVCYPLKGGLRTTVMNSLMARKLWDKAVLCLEDMKRCVPLKHARMYPTLVQGLAESGYVNWAVKYFLEMQTLEMNLQTTKSRAVSQAPMVALLDAAARVDVGKQPNLIVSGIQQFEIPSAVSPREVLHHVISYMETWNLLLSDAMASAIVRFTADKKRFPFIARRIHDAEVLSSCPKCGDKLTWSPGFEDYPDVTKYVSDYFRKYLGVSKYKDEICTMNSVLNSNFYFEYIVDGSNVGLRGDTCDSSRRIFRADLLESLLSGFHAMESKVLVVLLHSTLRKGGLRHLSFLESVESRCSTSEISFIHLRHFDDDAALVYLAAMSEIERKVRNLTDRVKIVSNDSLVNQRFMFKGPVRTRFLKWIRQRQCRWSVTDGGKIALTPGGESVVRTSSGGYHVACEDGSFICL